MSDRGLSEGMKARLRRIRLELYGEGGAEELSARLGIPAATWRNYEAGVMISAHVLLRFVHLTGVEPWWLYTGEGRVYRSDAAVVPEAVPGGDAP
jgi:hypothetical protein